jgi:hypothetical protein
MNPASDVTGNVLFQIELIDWNPLSCGQESKSLNEMALWKNHEIFE